MRGGLRVIGYHGTSGAKADEIIRVGFKTSANRYDWLGRGIYFFEEDESRAARWAREHWPKDPAIVGAAIDLTNVVDLFDHDAAAALRDLARVTDESFTKRRTALPRNKGGRHDFDCLIVNLFCEALEQNGSHAPVVRGSFEEGELIHPNSSLRDLTHIQLAVRDPRAILGTWKRLP